jgi:leucyl aminopeptidase
VLQPIAVDLTSLSDALADAQSIAVGFTQVNKNPDKNPDKKPDNNLNKDEKPEYNFPSHAKIIEKLEETFEINLRDELAFYAATGKAGEIFEIPVSSNLFAADRILLIGLGDETTSAARQAGAALGRKGRGKALTIASLCVSNEEQLKAFAISVQLGAYIWTQKTGPTQEIPLFLFHTENPEAINAASEIANAISRTRDLVHTPSNIKTPLWLADEAVKIAADNGLEIKVLAGKDLADFGGLRAVGNSSPKPGPRFVEISYHPKGKKKSAGILPHVVIVGKGITFDTGGVSLKRPYEFMTAMKSDMAGSAAALGAISALPYFQPQVQVTVLMMLAENALSGTSQRPSDVITHYGGKTVEVLDTDAEGRLVLADGLAYADINLNPDYLIDIATLTGAATLGLGRQHAAMYTRDEKVAKSFSEAGERSGDRVWHMPLVDDYKEALESPIADLSHITSKKHFSAGSVTAALFLEHFAGDRTWVHFDIAGVARSESDSGENPKGGTGFGVRLLIEWLTSLS